MPPQNKDGAALGEDVVGDAVGSGRSSGVQEKHVASQPTRADMPASSSLESQRPRFSPTQAQPLFGDPLLCQLVESATQPCGVGAVVGSGSAAPASSLGVQA